MPSLLPTLLGHLHKGHKESPEKIKADASPCISATIADKLQASHIRRGRGGQDLLNLSINVLLVHIVCPEPINDW